MLGFFYSGKFFLMTETLEIKAVIIKTVLCILKHHLPELKISIAKVTGEGTQNNKCI